MYKTLFVILECMKGKRPANQSEMMMVSVCDYFLSPLWAGGCENDAHSFDSSVCPAVSVFVCWGARAHQKRF